MTWREEGIPPRRWVSDDVPGVSVVPWGAGFAALVSRYPEPPHVEVRKTLLEAMWAAEHVRGRTVDCLQEMLDAIVYAVQAGMEGREVPVDVRVALGALRDAVRR